MKDPHKRAYTQRKLVEALTEVFVNQKSECK